MAKNPAFPPDVPATFANRFWLSRYGGVVKICYGEPRQSDGEAVYHGAIAMTPEDAVELAKLILGHVGQEVINNEPPASKDD